MIDPSRPHPNLGPRAVAFLALAVLAGVIGFGTFHKGGSKVKAVNTSAPTTVANSPTDSSITDPVATTAASSTITTVPALPMPASPKPLPAGGLFEGGRPPQFVVISFDGAVDDKMLKRWTAVAKDATASLSFFLSAVYLLGDDNKTAYQGPKHNAGESEIKFALNGARPVVDFLKETVAGLRQAQIEGHELANHFGGHWCGPNGVNKWLAKDWAIEMDQFENLTTNLDALNKLSTPVGSPFLRTPVGTRTPCLEGNLPELFRVSKARGYRYDASSTRRMDSWPTQKSGLWSYGFPGVAFPAFGDQPAQPRPLLTVDFSLRENLDQGYKSTEAEAKVISDRVYAAFMAAFVQNLNGNRAPFEAANHFVTFSHDAFNQALARFMLDACKRPEVFCVNYQQLSDWLDAHKDKLPGFQTATFPKTAVPAT